MNKKILALTSINAFILCACIYLELPILEILVSLAASAIYLLSVVFRG